MARVIKNELEICTISQDLIDRLKRNAALEPLRRARFNLHVSENDTVQEMVIAFCSDSLNPIHRHLGRTESLHAIEGRAEIVIFNDQGDLRERIVIGASGTGLPTIYRLSAPLWHTVIPLDSVVVLHEVAMGPFKPGIDSPAWAPRDEKSLRLFIAALREGTPEIC